MGDCTKASIAEAVVAGRRGAKCLRRALALADGRSESPWETILRLVHVPAGITDVEPQSRLRDENDRIVARGDLRLGPTRRIPEYDGGVHRERRQHENDLRRDKLLARLGFERYGYTATEIHHNARQIIADAEDALELERDTSRAEGWFREFRQSSLSNAGREMLANRMARFERQTSPRQAS